MAFFFFHCKLYLVVESIEVVQKFCQRFLAVRPDESIVTYLNQLIGLFVACSFDFFSKSSINKSTISRECGEPIATPSVCFDGQFNEQTDRVFPNVGI